MLSVSLSSRWKEVYLLQNLRAKPEMSRLAKTEEALDRREKAGSFGNAGLGRFRASGKVGLPLSDGPADGFGEVGIGLEDMFHRCVTNLKNLGFFHCDDVGGSRFAGKKRHFAEEISVRQRGDRARRAPVRYLNGDAAIVNYKH